MVLLFWGGRVLAIGGFSSGWLGIKIRGVVLVVCQLLVWRRVGWLVGCWKGCLFGVGGAVGAVGVG